MILDESARQFDTVCVSHGGAAAAAADRPRAAGTLLDRAAGAAPDCRPTACSSSAIGCHKYWRAAG
jgi:hypothetical protein